MNGAKGMRKASSVVAGLLLLATATTNTARAQDLPDGLAPLDTASDVNGVNILTGQARVSAPVLSVPAAPNLRFDVAPSAAPYLVGRSTGAEPDQRVEAITVNTADGSSVSFRCVGVGATCESVTGDGSTLGAGRSALRRGRSGEQYVFGYTHVNQTSGGFPRVRQLYVSRISYPSGEEITYQYNTARLDGDSFNRAFYRPTRITSTLGYSITLSYQGNDFNADGNAWQAVAVATLVKDSDPSTPLARLTYGASGSITDLAGRVYQCSGCATLLGNKVEVSNGSLVLPGDTSPAVQYIASATSGNGQLIGAVVKDGVQWNYSYQNLRSSGAGWWYDSLTVTGPNDYLKVYGLAVAEKQNSLTSATETVGGVTRTTRYLGTFRPVKVTLPEQNAVQLGYDELANVTERRTIAKPGSGLADIVETAAYPAAPCSTPACFRPIWVRDGRLAQTDYVYNAGGYVTERTDPADANGVRRKTYVTYDGNTGLNRKTVVRVCGTGAACGSASEQRTEYDYWEGTFLPSAQRRIDQATGTVLTTTFAYDAAGRALSVDGPRAGSEDATYVRYDVLGRKLWEIGPAGTGGARPATRYAYRASDDKVESVETGSVPDASSTALTVTTRTDTVYDAHRNPVRETTSSGGVAYGLVQRSFDDRGRLECEAVRMNPAAYGSLPASACALGVEGAYGPDRITRTLYDSAGEVVQVQRAVGTALQQNYATYAYSANGKATAMTDANGNRAEFGLDGFDRQVRWTFPSKTSAGQVSAADYEEYGYDANGNRVSLRKRDGTVLGYQYDALDQVVVKSVPGSATGAAGYQVFYGYDAGGRQLYARFGSASGEGVTNAYDALGRAASATLAMGGTSRTLSYAWDAAGNRTRVTHPDGVYFDQGYDAGGRLAAASWWTPATGTVPFLSIAYDALGRRTNVTRGSSATGYGYDGASRLLDQDQRFAGGAGNVAAHFGYNPAGQVTSRTRSSGDYAFTGYVDVNRAYAVNGLNQYTSAGPASFGYDANGNLTGDGTRSYVYDAENRLVSTSDGVMLAYDPLGRLWRTGGGPWGVSQFLYDGDRLAAEYDADTGAMRRRFMFAGQDEPVLEDAGGSMNCSGTRFLHTDHQGSVIALADCWGTRTNVDAYDEYGIPNATNAGRFQYTGQMWVPELGMYHYKARLYSPTLGRFLQTDPIGYDDQNNLYAYVANDPVNGRDPTGTEGDFWQRTADVVIGTAEVGVGAFGTVVGGAIATTGAVTEVGTLGISTPVSVPTTVGGIAVVAGSLAIAYDGSQRIVRGLLGTRSPTISENRGNRGGQGRGERGQTAKPSGSGDAGKHANPGKGYRTDNQTGKKIPLAPTPPPRPSEPERSVTRGKKLIDD